jgi:hypothetical protein
MTEFDYMQFYYMQFSDGRWIFNTHKYTKREAATIWFVEISKQIVNNDNLSILSPKEPYKYFAKFVNCDEILDYDVECECCEDPENYDEPGCYVLTEEANCREKEENEFEVWVFPSIQDLKNGTWEKEK